MLRTVHEQLSTACEVRHTLLYDLSSLVCVSMRPAFNADWVPFLIPFRGLHR